MTVLQRKRTANISPAKQVVNSKHTQLGQYKGMK